MFLMKSYYLTSESVPFSSESYVLECFQRTVGLVGLLALWVGKLWQGKNVHVWSLTRKSFSYVYWEEGERKVEVDK